MLSATVSKRLEALPDISKQGKRINGLFRLLESPELWQAAYAKIHTNKGAMTRGVDGTTMDGYSEERVANMIALLKDGRYAFKPVRRVYIPKANGKRRPLGLPSGDDKLVQEVTRGLLARIYEPIFSDWSHGFRPQRSCHTALQHVQRLWDGVKWLVEVDIQGFYDNIDHDIMIRLLQQKIDDKRFVDLIKAMLQAGYVEDWKFHQTYSGTPQGGIASPILANVYLHELDTFIAGLKAEFDHGARRASNPEYEKYRTNLRRLRREKTRLQEKGDASRLRALEANIRESDTIRRTLPAGNPFDRTFRRLYYCRYADDFLIGIIGSKKDAQDIMRQTRRFLEEHLNLTIATDKSGIHHAKKGVTFLGYDVRTYSGDKVVKARRGRETKVYARVRSVVERIQLHIPEEKVRKFCKEKGYGIWESLQPTHKPEWLQRSDPEIILAYNAEMRGFAHYYSLAQCAKLELHKLYFIWQTSLFKTLAWKHRASVTKIAKQLRGKRGYEYKLKTTKGYAIYKVFSLKDLKGFRVDWKTVDVKPRVLHFTLARTEITQRLQAQKCEYCGKEGGYFEVHHVRKLKDVRGQKEVWQQIMAAMRRKTIILCVDCHQQLHHGTLPPWKRRKMNAESRIH
jgi:group II intron reverse transcriptase/maturase